MSKFKIKVLNFARWLSKKDMPKKFYAYVLSQKTHFFLKKSKPLVLVLSLGEDGHSYSVVKAAKTLGLRVYLVSPRPVIQEMIYSNYLLRLDPLNQTEEIIQHAKSYNIEGVVVAIKHILLPAQAEIAERLGCISVGKTSATLCNNKLEWRMALAESQILQPKFSKCRDDLINLPVVQKPKSGTGSKGVIYLEANKRNQANVLPPAGIDKLTNQKTYFEEYLEGEQFDIEGVSWNGDHKIFVLVKEKYIKIKNQFPPKYFYFNPIMDKEITENIQETVYKVLDASGIINGAWHVEGRVINKQFYPIDFANRMGYERFVTRASGVNFGAQHLSAFIDGLNLKLNFKKRFLLQYFSTTEKEMKILYQITREFPENVFDLITEPFKMSTLTYRGMIVLESSEENDFKKITSNLVNV